MACTSSRRTKVEIVFDILSECRTEPCDKHALSFRCGVAPRALAGYLKPLVRRRLIEMDPSDRYRTTEQGDGFAFRIGKLLDLINERTYPGRATPFRIPGMDEMVAEIERWHDARPAAPSAVVDISEDPCRQRRDIRALGLEG